MFFIFVVIIIIVLIYGIHRYVLDKMYNLPPGPLPWPYMGNLGLIISLGKSRPWQLYLKLASKYGPVFTFYFGQLRWTIVTGPEAIQELLVKQGKTFSSRPVTQLPGMEELKPGVIFCNGDDWVKRRRFCIRTMRDFGMGKMAIAERIQDEVAHLIAQIDSFEGKPFEPRQLLANAVSNVVCSIVFGKRFNYGDPEFVRLSLQLQKIFARKFTDNAMFILIPALHYVMRPKQSKDLMVFQDMMSEMVSASLAEHRKDFNHDSMRDFIDLFIQNELEPEGIDLEAFSFVMLDMFVAGTETTATALNWAWLFMAFYPDVQKKCQALIDSVIDTDRYPTLSDRPKMLYIDAVMNEVLRHASVFPSGALHCNLGEDAKLAGYDIPANSIILFSIAAQHRDPKYWDKPDDFDPNRWLDSSGNGLMSHSSHFLPFGLGPRTCLGESLAKAEFFIFVVSVLHRFNFELVDRSSVDLSMGSSGVTHVPPRYEIIATRRN